MDLRFFTANTVAWELEDLKKVNKKSFFYTYGDVNEERLSSTFDRLALVVAFFSLEIISEFSNTYVREISPWILHK